jgi:hypothetical protein
MMVLLGDEVHAHVGGFATCISSASITVDKPVRAEVMTVMIV